MTNGETVRAAIEELRRALASLDNALDMRFDRERDHGEVEGEVRRVNADRSRLAQELEGRRQSFAAITEDWSAEDVRAFSELMRRFNEKVEAQRGQHWPREK